MRHEAGTLSMVRSRDGTAIAVERTGTGPALVIVDGALCSRAFGPSGATAAGLRDDFTVYRYDRRGRGDSGDTLPYAVAREVEDLAAVIAEAGGSASVYGISSGAALALEAAASGVPVSALALFEPPWTAEGGGANGHADDVRRMGDLLAAGRNDAAVELFFSWVGMPAEGVAHLRTTGLWPVLESTAPTLRYDNAVMGDGTVPRRSAERIRVPTLVLAGSLSSRELRASATVVAAAIPGARYRELEGEAHDAAPESLVAPLREFLR